MAIVPATDDRILEAAALLRAGAPVAMPTETVYGLAADATDGLAVARLYELKARPRFNPLIIHVAGLPAADRLAAFSAAARHLAETYWPGPLTLVLPLSRPTAIADLCLAGHDTIAIRIPSHPVAQALLREVARPLAAPSANRSGHVSPTRAAHVDEEFGEALGIVLDGGPSEIGLESTIASVMDDHVTLLRPGAITRAAIETTLSQPVSAHAQPSDTRSPTAPGQLASHYAPNARVRLNVTQPESSEAYLGFADNAAAPDHPMPSANLSPTGDLREAAANLFADLRKLDQPGIPAIAVAPIPTDGLGEAINDRLRRAAAPRT